MRLTPRGIGLLVAGVLMLAASFQFGYPEFAVLGSACVVAVAGSLGFVAWRPRLVIDRNIDPDRVTRGEPSRITLRVVNASRLFGANVIAHDRLRHWSDEDGAAAPVPLIRLRPQAETAVNYSVPTTRRGVVELGPLEITRQDPLALAAVVRRYGSSAQVWVRPRVHPVAAVLVGLSRSLDGRVDRVPHGSITFAALREYVVGDDLRHVHWRTSARVGELMVRERVDTSLPRLVILLDDRADAHRDLTSGESTFEAACEAAASVLVAAARDGVRVDIRLVSRTGATSGEWEIGSLLDMLAEVTPAPAPGLGGPALAESALPAAVERLRLGRFGDTLLYLTGPPIGEDLGIVAGLRGAYPSIIAGVFGTVESGLATTADLLVVGAENGADFAAAWDGVHAW